MDVVEFVEQVFGLHLMDYQKEFLIKVYEATRDGQSVMYIPGRCYRRSSFKLLEASAIIFDAQTKGLLKPVNSEMIRGVSVMVKVKDILPLIQWNDAQIIKDQDEEICLLRNDFMVGSLSEEILNMTVTCIENDENIENRVGYHIGDFFGLGFVNAIGTYAVKAYNASAEMADSAKTGLGNAIAKVKDMIDNGVDGQPMIRPILDLSDVEEKSHRLNTMFSRSQALTVSTGIAAARGRNLQNEDTNPNTGNSYNFTQNNYSPKALSRTEIYRQTKNQFSAMERMVET